MRRLTKFHNSVLVCPKCRGRLTPLPQFEGRPRVYCAKCEEEIIDLPWSDRVGYPQEDTAFLPGNLEGFR